MLALTWPGHRMPPPSDVEAEQDVVSGVLCGVALPSTVGVTPSELLVPLYREVLVAATALEGAGAGIDVHSVAAEMQRMGRTVGDLDSLLDTMMCTTPYVVGQELRRRAARVRERYAARALCRELIGLDGMLRADLIDVASARERLASIAGTVVP